MIKCRTAFLTPGQTDKPPNHEPECTAGHENPPADATPASDVKAPSLHIIHSRRRRAHHSEVPGLWMTHQHFQIQGWD
ncbi:MAG: hypothetical protein INR71_00060 [Terriglobus roseus]|nr:hypothetical protein [Terriglobus roseus]